jgi:hypothetical protein
LIVKELSLALADAIFTSYFLSLRNYNSIKPVFALQQQGYFALEKLS